MREIFACVEVFEEAADGVKILVEQIYTTALVKKLDWPSGKKTGRDTFELAMAEAKNGERTRRASWAVRTV